MNVMKRELRAYCKQLLFWCLGVAFLIVAGLMKFQALTASGESIAKLFVAIPPMVRAVLGIQPFDLGKLSGYYGMIQSYLMMALAIHAILLGADIVVKEETNKTAEFIYTKPQARSEVLVKKMIVACFQLLVLNLVQFLATVGMMVWLDESFFSILLPASIYLLLMQLVYLLVGLFFATSKSKQPMRNAMIFFLMTYILASCYDLLEIPMLRAITPLRFFPVVGMYQNQIAWDGLLLVFVVTMVLWLVSLRLFQKKDITIHGG